MAAYQRGQERSENGKSGHNNQAEKAARRRLPRVDLEAVNFEQQRAPYGSNTRSAESEWEEAGNRPGTGARRDEP